MTLQARGRHTVRMAPPAFIPPMLATLVAVPFDDPDWLFEIKWDGFRVEAVIDGGSVRLFTRGGLDAAATYFGDFLAPGDWLAAGSAVVDGEVVALDERGEPDFALLQGRIKRGGGGFTYQAFDLLALNGASLLEQPLRHRKARLQAVIREDARVRYCGHVEGHGLAFYEAAKARGLEGIMAKDGRSPYLPGTRTTAWQKVKIRPEQELVVGGWAAGKARLEGTLGALHVGVYEDGALRYAGKVGAGFTRVTRAELLDALRPLEAAEAPFSPAPPRRLSVGSTWVRPDLVIRAEFAGWTGDGLVRQASYKGLDLGKDPGAVVREVPGADRV
jgi:bifunctional non-homologous end joining protein LigD